MSTPDGTSVPTQRGRWQQPKQYPAQLILVTTADQEHFVRTYAATKGVSVTSVLRDLVQGGINALDPVVRALVETDARDDGATEEGEAGA